MHCPMCGSKMKYLDRTEEKRQAFMKYRSEVDAWLEEIEGPYPEEKKDESEHLECTNGNCILNGTYFILHHPFKGLDSKRGDSFSLSWVK